MINQGIYQQTWITHIGFSQTETGHLANTQGPKHMSIFMKSAAIAAAALTIAYGLGQHKSQSIHTEIEIDAPTEVVWAELTDTGEHANWNPFIKDFKGEIEVGSQLDVTIQPPGGSATRFRPIVLAADANEELRWIGQLGFEGIFDGEHYFILEEQADGTTLLRHGETFTGMLADLLYFIYLEDAATKGFEAMNVALKERAEAQI